MREQLKALPPQVRRAISSVDLRSKIGSIGTKHALHIDQVGLLENETLLTMLGLEPLDEYAGNIETELRIPREKALQISADINAHILEPIRSFLRDETTPRDEPPAPAPLKEQPTFSKPAINNGLIEPSATRATVQATATTAAPQPTKKEVLIAPAQVPVAPPPIARVTPPAVSRPAIPIQRPIVPVPSANQSSIQKPVADSLSPKPQVPWPTRAEALTPKPALKIPQNFMEAKLSGEVSIPTQNIFLKKPPEPPAQRSGTDPYREPVN